MDFSLIMTNAERWRFVQEKSGLQLFNEVMRLVAEIRTYDVVILIGSRQRINWSAALLDKEVIGIVLGSRRLLRTNMWIPATCGISFCRYKRID